jgi:hypothetical protein
VFILLYGMIVEVDGDRDKEAERSQRYVTILRH